MSLLRKLLGLLVLVAATTAFASAPVKPFTTESYAAILAAHRGQPLVVAFWSLDCAHCPGSLATLARFARAHPKVSVVLVATDTGADPAALASHVRQAALAQAEQWVFADPLPERLRLSIDSRWWGELPRSYLIAADGTRSAHSGVLDAGQLAQWLSAQRQP
ncbi:MAG: hypothetical protein IPH08_18455 [Rhodocyclaceae bacterium]|nr:hypothetical protein [Rhodocyclaceae bacterium]MBK6908981.1 hypothetical protein [Rhodocyclaceae bacterium]